MKYRYYYNDVPGEGLSRNNLVYTSLISEDQKTFVQWYYNDTEYHSGQNEIVDIDKMEEKWQREIKYLTLMADHYSNLIPTIIEIDEKNKKIYLEIDGLDFWNRSKCNVDYYSTVVADWKEQILEILHAHRNLGLYKFSLHPSSYWPVKGQLKSINYFFTYHESEGPISISDHASHIYSQRQTTMRPIVESMGLSWDDPEDLIHLQRLCLESFRMNYTNDFIDTAKKIYDYR